MSTLVKEQVRIPSILGVRFANDMLESRLSDGRIISVPIAWYPKLASATKKQLKNFEISPSGYGIHWSDLDEDLSVAGFLHVSYEIEKKEA
ncbi:DUF2442 domain-containing protein [Candidatus Desantisbacteria bacterium CG_4_10_14_0_8_um_filter_39_17]|uniref:DUF2442 domain-containing protein n=1 Tax=Candidatus Desantisbacteria bacterium CG_4_10_14_0_8_um_filter_39_17 TaxID=1974542 RepID=A0A2H9PD65_9BACT|nr:MAG: DUF2442 domain-containing protein [Candidatus Desantisbacteria bacterium CG_4_10_14_0_8_um_filter_39_17]